MRPDSIRKFDLFYLASMAIGVASALMNFDSQVGALEARFAELGVNYPAEGFLLTALGVAFALSLLLWYLVAQMRLGFVKWIIMAFVLYSVGTTGVALSMGMGSVSITGLLNVVLKVIAVSFLFRADAKEWFATRSQ